MDVRCQSLFLPVVLFIGGLVGLVVIARGTASLARERSESTAEDPADSIELTVRFSRQQQQPPGPVVTQERTESWRYAETAMIVCDVWDYHHSLNAVRRLEQFAPRLNQVLSEARRRGVTIIHAPSDCMAAYADHPARRRAESVAPPPYVPPSIDAWCSQLPTEQGAVYPLDQSDGGTDDDPAEHAQWEAKLIGLGRNPHLPWQRQSEMITIDPERDYLSDRGGEIWNILQARKIRHVILTGVHTNMCVLGRPFGLRQMARNGMNVVLLRDLTDTMYNPQRWPYVSHHEGTRRIIAHIERFICPTISSDQWIGGEEFRFANDHQTPPAAGETGASPLPPDVPQPWTLLSLPPQPQDAVSTSAEPHWYRATCWLPRSWKGTSLEIGRPADRTIEVWVNGQRAAPIEDHPAGQAFILPAAGIVADDVNLIVIKSGRGPLVAPPVLSSGDERLVLAGRWQRLIGEGGDAETTLPLPAKFGASSDILFTPEDPLWIPRAVTQSEEFTPGIEGPACDREGILFAVNYARQGTIGRVFPSGLAEVFLELPPGSIGNGIRFAPDGTFFIADYTGHNVLRADPLTQTVKVHAHHPGMNQPNDLALSPDGKTLFASDPNWGNGTGNLWRIDADGTVTRLASDQGTTNGIDVSPDGKTLYVNESQQRNVWAFTITDQGTLADKRLLRQFPDHGFDGMRCDAEGNLYITRYGKGTVVKMTPAGEILREIPVLGERPSNLCFGGKDRRTVYVTQVDRGQIIRFRVDVPGRE